MGNFCGLLLYPDFVHINKEHLRLQRIFVL